LRSSVKSVSENASNTILLAGQSYDIVFRID
jgi:hypothetical protein